MTLQKKITVFKTTIFILTALLSILAIYSYKSYQTKEQDLQFFKSEQQLFLEEINAMALRYDSVKLKSVLKTTEINNYKIKIDQLKSKVLKNKFNYQTVLNYRKELDILKQERDNLYAIADSLEQETLKLQKERDIVQNELNENIAVNYELIKTNNEYKSLIKKASILKASSFKSFGIKYKSTGSIYRTSKASKTESIKVSFQLNENELVEPGDKTIYIQVLNSKNNIIGDKKYIEFEDGKSLIYSCKETITYNNTDLVPSFFISTDKDYPLIPGNYTINIFNDFNLLGTTTLTLF